MNFAKITRLLFFILPLPLVAQHMDNRPVIGVSYMHVSDEKAETLGLPNDQGIMLTRVWDISPAADAGLQPLDYITRVGELELSRRLSFKEALSKFEAEDKTALTVWRKGEEQTVPIALVDRDAVSTSQRTDSEDPFLGIYEAHDEILDGINGVAISVATNSTAWAMGLEKGDIITRVDGYPIVDWHDLNPIIDNRKVGDDITLVFWRNGQLLSATRPIKSAAATHNTSSRHDGLEVEKNPDPNAVEAEVIVELLKEEEVAELERDMEEDMPAIVDLQLKELKLFPNPNNGVFDVQFELPQPGRTTIRIFNAEGRQIYFNDLGAFSGVFSDRIDIANNARGVYFLELRQGDLAEIRRVILQ